MMSDIDTLEFRPGESLEWITREGDNTLVKRRVRFIQPFGTDEAVVEWGMRSDGTGIMNRYTAQVAELSRESEVPARPWWVPEPIQTPRPPEPPTEQQIGNRLAERREALRGAHETARNAQEAVTAARQVADRAQREANDARARLAEQTLADQREADAFSDSIRRGEAPPPHRNGIDREALRSRVAVAEQAEISFDRELATANSMLADTLSGVRKAAADVIAALVEREAESLRALETEAARQRAELVAVAAWWPSADLGPPKLSSAAGQLLEAVPRYGEMAVVRASSRALDTWKDIFSQLVSGDAGADFRLEKE
jgi:hypothetical protein